MIVVVVVGGYILKKTVFSKTRFVLCVSVSNTKAPIAEIKRKNKTKQPLKKQNKKNPKK